MNQTNDHDFQQFRGQFDDAMIPDASFKAKMEKLLQSEKPIDQDRKSTVLASPSRQQSETVVPGRRSHPLMIAVAILMVFAVVISSVWVLSGDVLEGEYASAPSGIPTLPADAPGTPGPDVHLNPERIDSISRVNEYFGMYDGLLILRAPVELPDNRTDPNQEPNVYSDVLVAIEPDSGSIVWEQPYHGFRAIDASNGVLIGIANHWDNTVSNQPPTLELQALDLTTGETLWSVQKAEIPASHAYPGVAVLNNVVMAFSGETMLIARNLTDGEVVWESEFDPGDGWLQKVADQSGETRTEHWYSVAITTWNDMLVIINGDGLVQLVDPKSGNLTIGYQFDWPQPEHFGSKFIELHAMNEGVVLYQQMAEEGGSRSRLTAFDPTDGSLIWEFEVDGQQFVDVASNGNVALQSITWKSSNWLQRLFGNHGDSIRSLTWINGNTGEVRITTEPGVVNDGPPDAVTDGTYVCSRTGKNEISCYDATGKRYILEIEPTYEFDLVDGVLYVPTENGMFRVELP